MSILFPVKLFSKHKHEGISFHRSSFWKVYAEIVCLMNKINTVKMRHSPGTWLTYFHITYDLWTTHVCCLILHRCTAWTQFTNTSVTFIIMMNQISEWKHLIFTVCNYVQILKDRFPTSSYTNMYLYQPQGNQYAQVIASLVPVFIIRTFKSRKWLRKKAHNIINRYRITLY